MSTLGHSIYPDKMLHNAAFYKGLHCLLIKINLHVKKYNIFLNYYTLPHNIYTKSA